MYDAFVSVDLGRQVDYTAIVVAEEARWIGEPPDLPIGISGGPMMQELMYWQDAGHWWVPPSSLAVRQREYFRSRNYQGFRPDRPPLLVRHIERVRNRPYPQIVTEIGALLARPPLSEMSVITLVDAGGVGVAVSDLMWQQGIAHISITATGGDTVNVSDAGKTIRCPKRELVSAAQICLAQGRLRIAAGLARAPTLTSELTNYRVSISVSGHDSYSAREGEHDDLVYAAAQLCWYRDWLSQYYDDGIAREQQQAAAEAARAERLGPPASR